MHSVYIFWLDFDFELIYHRFKTFLRRRCHYHIHRLVHQIQEPFLLKCTDPIHQLGGQVNLLSGSCHCGAERLFIQTESICLHVEVAELIFY